jgi:predicted SprT family Zn-dependent metalloprotease
MKIFTLYELQLMKGYNVLKNILSEAELQFYYNTPPEKRGVVLENKSIVSKQRPQIKPSVQPTISNHTQLCTSIQEINTMAQNFMAKTFVVDGKSYCMNDMGWRFQFNSVKSSFGQCSRRYNMIYLSEWMIRNTKNDMAFWIDTMLHEIAHAIDYTKRGTSDHSWRWKAIARAVGCNANRTGTADYAQNVNSKYTSTCPNCKKQRPRHKMTRAMRFGSYSCGVCLKKTGIRYKIVFTQNY